MNERLNKVLARAGVASRRRADALIAGGRVEVNGRVASELGLKVDPERDAIKVDGKRIPPAPRSYTYLMVNKPRGFVTTLSDPQGRPTIRDLLARVKVRVYPVGRLDYATEGLLILTDDGDLARTLMHPGSAVPKTYLAKVAGVPERPALARLERGVSIDGRKSLPAKIGTLRQGGGGTWVEVTVVEGRKHQVRRMLEAIGHPVQKLRRVGFAGLEIGDLARGAVRPLSPREIGRLRRAAGGREAARRDRSPRRN